MRYLITYTQTPHERFETGMNDEARRMLQAYGLVVEGESGGTNMLTGVADQSFVVKGTRATATAARDALADKFNREVDMEAN